MLLAAVLKASGRCLLPTTFQGLSPSVKADPEDGCRRFDSDRFRLVAIVQGSASGVVAAAKTGQKANLVCTARSQQIAAARQRRPLGAGVSATSQGLAGRGTARPKVEPRRVTK